MNRKTIIAAATLAAAFAGNAFAESPLVAQNESFASTKTRAEVQGELAAFKRAGTSPWSIQYSLTRGFQSTTSRAAVQAAYIADRDQVAAFTSEDGGADWLRHASLRTPVRDTLAAR